MWRPSPITIRFLQLLCACTCLFSSIAGLASDGNAIALISTTWASFVSASIAILALFFFRRPLDLWALAVTIDALAIASLAAALTILCMSFGYQFVDSIAVTSISFGILAYLTSATRTILLHRKHTKQIKPADPFKPYLMKKEVDVWCYPVQNEQGQLFMDYEPVSSSGASKAPSINSMRARSVKSFVRVDDGTQDTNSSRPLSSVETTAGWSVPSQNETLPQSVHNTLPLYRPTAHAQIGA